MKLLILFLSALSLSKISYDLNTIRNAYKIAVMQPEKIESFNNSLIDITKNDAPTLIAYKGAGIALLAKKSRDLKEKKELFVKGVTLLELAVEKSPNTVEIRFIRLGIQENTPKILKYKTNIEEDKKIILHQFNTIKSKNLKKHLKDYILESKIFSDKEKNVVSEQ